MDTSIPFNISLKDYLATREIHFKLVEKIRPLSHLFDAELRQLIENMNDFYYSFEDRVNKTMSVPSCFDPGSCLSGSCTSDITVCKYVSVLKNNPLAVRVKNESVAAFSSNGWKLVGKDVRDDEIIKKSDYSIMVPIKEE